MLQDIQKNNISQEKMQVLSYIFYYIILIIVLYYYFYNLIILSFMSLFSTKSETQ